jgi:serpin B
MSMLILLPKAKENSTTEPAKEETPKIERLEQVLTAEYIKIVWDHLKFGNVILSMPRWKMSQEFELSEGLQKLGMKTAFGPEADFSRMTEESLRVSSVVHKACICVDENGTVASAWGGLGGYLCNDSSEPVEIRLDRPFVYLIIHNPTGAILFGGRVMDPSKEN